VCWRVREIIQHEARGKRQGRNLLKRSPLVRLTAIPNCLSCKLAAAVVNRVSKNLSPTAVVSSRRRRRGDRGLPAAAYRKSRSATVQRGSRREISSLKLSLASVQNQRPRP
jgi:hypothetical protein